MDWKIPLFKSYWEKDDVEAVSKVISRGSYWANGPEIKDFEDEVVKYIGKKYVLTFNSGTSALHALLEAYNVKKDDEVIVPSFTFIATANSPLFVGAKPIFADIEEETYGLDADDVENKITKNTKAIMPIHYGGCPCKNIKRLKEIAEKKDILLLEDAAQSLGGAINKKKVGNFGDASMFSLCQDKMITTGEGGIIVTDSRECYEKLKLLRSHGRAETSNYFSSNEIMDYITLGYNFRMPTMNAALGLSQMKKIDKIIKIRREKARLYNDGLSGVKDVSYIKPPKGFFNVYQKYPIIVENGKRNELKKHLSEKKIFTKSYFDEPVHQTKFYKDKYGYKKGFLPVTEKIAEKILNLPIFPSLKDSEVKFITKSIKEFFR